MAHERAKYDRRCARAARPLFYVTLAYTGLRYAEAKALRWKDVDLTTGWLITDPVWAKNRRRQGIPIADELSCLLHAHFRTVPNQPTDRVFPKAPSPHTIGKDREAAGIPYMDGRGRVFSFHSTRKWLATTLDSCGVSIGVRHRITRHYIGLDVKYVDVSVAAEVDAIGRLPSLWPEDLHMNRQVQTEKESLKSPGPPGRGIVSSVKPATVPSDDPLVSRDDPSQRASHSTDGERGRPSGRLDSAEREAAESATVHDHAMGRAWRISRAQNPPQDTINGTDAAHARGAQDAPPGCLHGEQRSEVGTPHEAAPLQRMPAPEAAHSGASSRLLEAPGSRMAVRCVPYVAALPLEVCRPSGVAQEQDEKPGDVPRIPRHVPLPTEASGGGAFPLRTPSPLAGAPSPVPTGAGGDFEAAAWKDTLRGIDTERDAATLRRGKPCASNDSAQAPDTLVSPVQPVSSPARLDDISLLAAVAPPPGDSGLSTPGSGAATSPGSDCSDRGTDAPLIDPEDLADVQMVRRLPVSQRRKTLRDLIELKSILESLGLYIAIATAALLGTAAAAAYGAWGRAEQPVRCADDWGRP